eukprot:12935325-Alexandrium_andersonii.AAC.1
MGARRPVCNLGKDLRRALEPGRRGMPALTVQNFMMMATVLSAVPRALKSLTCALVDLARKAGTDEQALGT